MLYTLPELNYPYDALVPHIDAETMELHHARRHRMYVNRLNRLLEGRPKLAAQGLEDLLHDIRAVPEDIRQALRNYGGAHLNHSLLWKTIGTEAGGEPDGFLRQALLGTFNSLPDFREELTSAALNRFGSGWAWLGVETDGALAVVSTPNEDSPIMLGLQPILGVDVWEHAYYLKYRDRPADYLRAWWNVVNWPKVAELYRRALTLIAQSE